MSHKKSKYIVPKITIPIMLIVLMIVSLAVYANKVSCELKADALSRLKEIAQSNRVVICSVLDEKQRALEQMVNFIKNRDIRINYDNIALLREISQSNDFDKIGIINSNDDLFIIDGKGEKSVKLENTQGYYARALENKNSIIRRDDASTGQSVLIFKMPIEFKGRDKSVLFATCDIERLREYISLDIFYGNGYSIITNKNGDKIIESNNAIKLSDDTRNIVNNIQAVNGIDLNLVQNFKEDLQNNKSGLLKFDSKTEYGYIYCYYQPLGIDNLYLMTIIPAKFIDNKYNMFIDNTYFLFSILCGIIILILAAIIFLEKKKQNDLRKILFEDKITKGFSYERFYKEVESWIKTDGNKNKAFIALDIDNFKIINDVFGYQVGNKLLRQIFNILLETVRDLGFFTREYADNFAIVVKYETNKS